MLLRKLLSTYHTNVNDASDAAVLHEVSIDHCSVLVVIDFERNCFPLLQILDTIMKPLSQLCTLTSSTLSLEEKVGAPEILYMLYLYKYERSVLY